MAVATQRLQLFCNVKFEIVACYKKYMYASFNNKRQISVRMMCIFMLYKQELHDNIFMWGKSIQLLATHLSFYKKRKAEFWAISEIFPLLELFKNLYLEGSSNANKE